MKDLIIYNVVGYMLKVMRKNTNITNYKDEFAAIRHGNYDKFITLMKVDEPPMAVYNNGIIKTENFSTASGDCAFAMIAASGPALKEFYKKCYNHYGNIIDNEISDDIYKKLVEFEICLRIHCNNNQIIERNLIDIIDKFCDLKNYDDITRKRLHIGRDYINYVKHPTKNFKNHAEGILAFNDSFNVLIENNLVD